MHKIQKAILEVAARKKVEGLTLRELGNLIGEQHPQKVKHHLNQLRAKGLLDKTAHRETIRQVAQIKLKSHPTRAIPILGAANCGEALLSADEMLEGFLHVSPSFVPSSKGLFAIKAVGNSMNRANVNENNIEEGDYVIIDSHARKPQNGAYVLSIINGSANIKKCIRDARHQLITLISESTQEVAPIYIQIVEDSDYSVNGTVVAVLKKPQATYQKTMAARGERPVHLPALRRRLLFREIDDGVAIRVMTNRQHCNPNDRIPRVS